MIENNFTTCGSNKYDTNNLFFTENLRQEVLERNDKWICMLSLRDMERFVTKNFFHQRREQFVEEEMLTDVDRMEGRRCEIPLEKIVVRLHRERRLVVIKLRHIPTFEHTIQLPHFVDEQKLKVKVDECRKYLIVKVPRRSVRTFECEEEMTRKGVWGEERRERIIPLNVINEMESDKTMFYKPETCWTVGTTGETSCNNTWIHRIEKCIEDSEHMNFKEHEIRCKVNRELRVVVLKIRDRRTTSLNKYFKRIVMRVPEHVCIEKTECKVFLKEETRKMVIHLRAPFRWQPIRGALFNGETYLNEFCEERRQMMLLEQPLEYEIGMYKMLKHWRRTCPMITPRLVRCNQTGELKMLLDLNCRTPFFYCEEPTELLVSKKQRSEFYGGRRMSTLVFHKWTREMQRCEEERESRNGRFELEMPSEKFDLDRLTKCVLKGERKCVRLTVPFLREKRCDMQTFVRY